MGPAIRFQVMPTEKGASRSFRFSTVTSRRLERLSDLLEKSDTAILEDAIAHMIGTLERDQPVWLTAPSDGRKHHKRGSDDAA